MSTTETAPLPAAFLTELVTAHLGHYKFRLVEPVVFRSVRFPGLFKAPAGFVTDLTSVPRAIWALYPRDGEYCIAAVIHDAAYEGQLLSFRTKSRRWGPATLIREFADQLLVEGMKVKNCAPFTQQVFYRGVRLGGAKEYKGLDHLRK